MIRVDAHVHDLLHRDVDRPQLSTQLGVHLHHHLRDNGHSFLGVEILRDQDLKVAVSIRDRFNTDLMTACFVIDK